VSNNRRILVVDDDSEVRSLIAAVLSDEGYLTVEAEDDNEAFSVLKTTAINLIFLDLWIGEDESAGLKILNKIRKHHPDIPVVIVSGHGTIDIAVKAIQRGAFDFVEKPFVIDRLLITTKKATEFADLNNENTKLRSNRIDADVLSIGQSAFAQNIAGLLDKCSTINSRVFIKSCEGISADSIAFYIHKKSQRKNYPFISFDCEMGSESVVDQKIFGTEKVYGCIENANFGTLMLDNIDKLPKRVQLRLLQFLQEGQFSAGERKSGYLDVRIIVGSRCLEGNVPDGFNSELLYRLNISHIDVLPLRDRRTDIVPLLNYYLNNSEVIFGLKSKPFTEESLTILQSYDWPGNIHQLKSVVESSLINALNKGEIDKDSLPAELTASAKDKLTSMNIANLITYPLKEAKDRFESEYLKVQISRFSGNISKTAEFVGMERSALHRKLKNLGVINDCRPKRR